MAVFHISSFTCESQVSITDENELLLTNHLVLMEPPCVSYNGRLAVTNVSISLLKVLTFLRPVKNSFAILVQQLANHLKGKEVVLEAELLTRSLSTVYGENLVLGKQYMFLRHGSKLATLPTGRSARKHPEAVYARCVLIPKSSMHVETCRKLEQGEHYTIFIKVSQCHLVLLLWTPVIVRYSVVITT